MSQEFLKKLNALPEVRESGHVCHQQTDDEWEFACRAVATLHKTHPQFADRRGK